MFDTRPAVAGGYPEVAALPERARRSWFANYIRTVTQRDITEPTGARRADQLPRLLGLLAARTANELILAQVRRDAGFGSRDTTDDYIGFTVDRAEFRWLELLRSRADDDFVHGFVLYCGARPLDFGDRLRAVPLASLWETGSFHRE